MFYPCLEHLGGLRHKSKILCEKSRSAEDHLLEWKCQLGDGEEGAKKNFLRFDVDGRSSGRYRKRLLLQTPIPWSRLLRFLEKRQGVPFRCPIGGWAIDC